MLKYTLAFFTQLLDDVKKTVKIMGLSVQGIYILYLVYAMIISQSWTFWMNLAVALISVAYFAFSIVMEVKEKNKTDKNVKRKVKKTYDATKKVIFVPTLVASIITMANLQSDNITISLIITVFVILSYAIYLLGILGEKVVNIYVNKFLVALESDVDSILPVINKFRRTIGDEVISIGGVDKDGSIKASLESIISEKEKNKESNKLQRAQTRAANRIRNRKEDRDKVKEGFKSLASKAKSKIKSLTAKKSASLPAPSEEKDKETANK